MSFQASEKPCKILHRALQAFCYRYHPTANTTYRQWPSHSHFNRSIHQCHHNKHIDSLLNLQILSQNAPLISLRSTLSSERRLISTETLSEKWRSAARRLQEASSQMKSTAPNLSGTIPDMPKGIYRPFRWAKNGFYRYRDVIGLQIEGFWKRNSTVFIGVLGIGMCFLVWRSMVGLASMTVGISEGLAKYGFLALATAIVAFAGLYVRAWYTINPDKVYRIAMRKLNTSAGILEVLGAPLSGTDVRAYIMSGGRLRFKNFRPSISRKRCFLIFPIQGSERRGLATVGVKKKKGQYDFKLLAVDIPMAKGPDQKIFLIGDEEGYKIGEGLISELRDPIIKAMAAEKEFDIEDDKEDEDERRKLDEEEKQKKEEMEQLDKQH
eukprot:TRINITY_DN3306_c0_g1_i1.p1 TRINITY_DN3306_c0_g1~~TRINITY_DN3306_c0_g1_i1.p1  ORF type:complete len:381 (+),score=75.33 TRINITY_DN3306_c0_g1_i1:172-1314(+)